MNLKARILAFIYQHSAGVSVIDMEGPLGERRMRLGYVTQCLLEEGKIRKIEDKYYPFDIDKEEDKDGQQLIPRSSIINK